MSLDGTPCTTVELNMGGSRAVLTVDPDNIKAVLASQFSDFGKGPQFNHDWKPFLGDSVFSTDHQQWQDSRAIVRKQFVRERLSDIEIIDRHVSALVEALSAADQDIKPLMFGFTLDTILDFLLGFWTNENLTNPRTKFAIAFAEIQKSFFRIQMMGSVNGLYPRRQLRKHLATFDAFIRPFVAQALALSPDELNNEKSDTFLHAIAAQTQDPTLLRDQLAAVLLAGRDTTACTLSWLFYELAFYPELVAELRQEIAMTIGFNGTPTFESLKTMRLLQHTLDETLRLYPAVPINARVALRDTYLPRGGGADRTEAVAMPRGTLVAYSTRLMHLSEDIYPSDESFPDPALFEPHRWDTWRPRPHTYIPFNAGPRLCESAKFFQKDHH